MNTLKNNLFAFIAVLMFSALFLIGLPVNANAQKREKSLTERVRHELVTLPYYGVFDNLAYKVDGSTVTLYGQVVRPTTQKDAARRVSKLEGVSNVVNDIEVLPLSSFDDSIRYRTVRAIANYGAMYRYFQGVNPSLHVIVKNGNVTLEGVVANKSDADLANIAANGVFGVFSVTNNLQTDREAR
ncbi:MAG: BON domain-containing protein [Pyrinomonadaceae bacterium]